MLLFALYLLIATVILIIVAFFYVSSIAATPPKGRADDLSKKLSLKSGRVIACIGDSLTHGNIGECWVESLRNKYPEDTVLNEGINGDVVWQVNNRIQSIINCSPDIIILMIGSNDAMASFNKKSGERYKSSNKLPEIPTFESYQKLLPKLLDKLDGTSKIALCTLPPIGENKDSAINEHVRKFNDFIELTAKNKNINLIPVSNLLWNELSKRTYPVKSDYDPSSIPIIRRIYGGMMHHYIFKKSWDEVAKSKGQWLLFDHIHLGERAAKILFNATKKYISSV
ncbi:SGNH/GDSL hydrolase family protein [Candidatus Pseudothioglobus sp. Uisw_050_01]|uniref:SGNH/GDSL hydrolase family protein n=1 Tax=Candidatus Pseudothioglobus sp. Uisw_050_01 TaxID=3230997 RepID=UPI003A8A577C